MRSSNGSGPSSPRSSNGSWWGLLAWLLVAGAILGAVLATLGIPWLLTLIAGGVLGYAIADRYRR